MKKIIILLICIFMTGCTVVRIDTQSIDNITNVILSKENKLYNRIGKGYKYYIPRGVSYLDTNELNDRLYADGEYYYLYIDAVSYFYKAKQEHHKAEDAYYYKEFEGDKSGYLKITQEGKKYYITFVYNYAKIEALVNKGNVKKVVLNASYILSTIKFNDNIIALMLNEDYFTNKEEQYDEFKTKQENNNFLEYKEEIEEK